MNSHRLPDVQPIFDQLPDPLMGVAIGDFIGFTGVQADLPFATVKDTESELPLTLHGSNSVFNNQI